jgi:hypothetical protein
MLHWVCIFWDMRVAHIRQYEMCTSGLEGSGLLLSPRSPGKVEDEDEWLVWTGTCDNHENATTKRLESYSGYGGSIREEWSRNSSYYPRLWTPLASRWVVRISDSRMSFLVEDGLVIWEGLRLYRDGLLRRWVSLEGLFDPSRKSNFQGLQMPVYYR